MIQKFIYPLSVAGILLVGIVMVFGSEIAHAASVFLTTQGGTGTSTPSGIMYGDNGATTHLNTLVIGANLTLTGNTLSASGGSGGTGAATTSFAGVNGTTLTTSASAITFTSAAWPFSYLVNPNSTFATSTDATSSSIWLKGGSFFSSSTQASQFPYATSTSLTILTTASTTNLVVSGITTASTQCLQVSNAGLVTGTNAGCANGSVTSITAGTGLAGGTITTTGTLSLPTIVGTSSSETAANIPFYTTTSATPALLSGGDATFTFTSATKKLVFLNGTSTNLSATGSFFAPNATSPSLNAAGAISINTTAASSSVQAFAGGQFGLYATTSASFTWATTSPSVNATDTIMIMNGPRGVKFDSIACRNIGGAAATTTIAIGTGVATSTYVQGTTNTPTFTTLSSNNSFNSLQTIFVAIGSYSYLGISQVSCGFGKEYTY